MRPSLLHPVAAGLGLISAPFWLCHPLAGRASAQAAPPPAPAVAPPLRALLPRLRRTAHIPILLPDIPGQGGPLLTDMGASGGGYTVTLYRAKPGQRLDISNQVADVSGLRSGPHPLTLAGQRVALIGGLVGHYFVSRQGASYNSLEWHQGIYKYRIGLARGTRAQLVGLANWAIRHPIPPDRSGA